MPQFSATSSNSPNSHYSNPKKQNHKQPAQIRQPPPLMPPSQPQPTLHTVYIPVTHNSHQIKKKQTEPSTHYSTAKKTEMLSKHHTHSHPPIDSTLSTTWTAKMKTQSRTPKLNHHTRPPTHSNMATHKSTILQWNCRGLRANLADLHILVQTHNPAVICLQETKITDTNYNTLTQYAHHCQPATTTNTLPRGGVSLFIHKSIPSSPVNLHTTFQAVAARVTLHTTLTICTIYLPPNTKWSSQDLQNLIQQLPPPIALLGDFNAHHPLWGNTRTDQAGREMEYLLTTTNLCLLNSKCATYSHPATGTLTSIDLSITSPSILQDFQWTVEGDPHGSDHFPIVLKTTQDNPQFCPGGWAFKRADWSKFSNLCDTTINRTDILNALDPILNLAETIIDIANQTIPKHNPNGRKVPKPWFSKEVKEKIAGRRRAFRKAQIHPTASNIQQYNIDRAQTRKVIRQSKRASWAQYISKLNNRTPIRKIWKIIGKISGKKSSPPRSHLEEGGRLITEEKAIANTLAKTFAHNSSSAHYSPTFRAYQQTMESTPIDFTTTTHENYNDPFSLTELEKSIQQSHDSAVGPDDIHYQLLRHLPFSTMQTVLDSFNHHWTTNSFPALWQQATVLPFPKPGKPPTNPSSYRPIALTSCLCKTMERMVNNRLIWYLESNNIINQYQSGFRKGRGTNDHLTRLETYIREALALKQHVLALFFDLEKATSSPIATSRYALAPHFPTCSLKKWASPKAASYRSHCSGSE